MNELMAFQATLFVCVAKVLSDRVGPTTPLSRAPERVVTPH